MSFFYKERGLVILNFFQKHFNEENKHAFVNFIFPCFNGTVSEVT